MVVSVHASRRIDKCYAQLYVTITIVCRLHAYISPSYSKPDVATELRKYYHIRITTTSCSFNYSHKIYKVTSSDIGTLRVLVSSSDCESSFCGPIFALEAATLAS